jgi:hypothetical protein
MSEEFKTSGIYYWFWHDFLCRLEPFTHQFRRMAKAHPVVFWGGLGSIMAGVAGSGLAFALHILEVF